jgi:taurine dioxygenase
MSNVKGPYVERGYPLTGEYMMHRDDTHTADPAAAMCLYAEEVTQTGGETIFINTERAYERLDPATRAALDRRTAIHIAPAAPGTPDFDPNQLATGFRASGGSPGTRTHQRWPVVRAHPVTGRPVLYVDPATFYGFEDLDPDAGDHLFNQVVVAFDEPEIAYRHRWAVGDVILWDNVSLLHARTAFPDTERRTLRKLLLGSYAGVTGAERLVTAS